MPFTAAELVNISNATLDVYLKKQPTSSTIQNKPFLKALMAKKKTFPGGKGEISLPVKGDYTTTLQGYTHNDQVGYSNPANIKRAAYPWKELHCGIELTLTELKHDGISITDSAMGDKTSEHSDRELTRLVNILEDKYEDMNEGYERSLNEMLWKDGTQDAKEIPGIRALVKNVPTTGTVGGLDQSVLTWWRNRTSLSVDSSTPSNQNMINTLQAEWRQLRRFGGNPDLFLAGSDFPDALEKEIRSSGTYTDNGFTGKQDASMGDIMWKGKPIVYDPTLDDLSLDKFLFVFDTSHVYLDCMEGEDKKVHFPARPHDEYVMYRAFTTTAGMCADQLNCHGVYSIA